jgi:hypothetical protein
MTDDEWQLETYSRFLMLRGGTQSELAWAETGELIRLFLQYFPNAAIAIETQRAETGNTDSVAKP